MPPDSPPLKLVFGHMAPMSLLFNHVHGEMSGNLAEGPELFRSSQQPDPNAVARRIRIEQG
jgi:hypothetical protein